MSGQIMRHHLRIRRPERLSAFYGDLLGMNDFGMENGAHLFGYDRGQCLLALRPGAVEPYDAKPDGFFWKTGITLRDLDMAVAYLRRQGHWVRDPAQFRDIGYLTHMTDPDGLVIELLQQGFEGRARSIADGHPIGAQATIAHITLRVTNIGAATAYFGGTLGMRLMSVQPVEALGFCLYFFACSDEELPDPDIRAVGNREWLWSRPYAMIELQHLMKPEARIRNYGDSARSGFIGFSGADLPNRIITPDLRM